MNKQTAHDRLGRSFRRPNNVSDPRWLGIVRRAIIEGWLVPRDLMNDEQRYHRMHIRSAYLAESNTDIDTAIARHVDAQDWLTVACLIELQLTP